VLFSSCYDTEVPEIYNDSDNYDDDDDDDDELE
jgi:hypothetical protein